MSFHEILFPEAISYGSSGGPAFLTTIIELASGHEQRNIEWKEQRANYDVSHGVKTREQMEELQDFFYARRGRAYGFRFKDWMDFEIEDQQIGLGDGTTRVFQAIKRYEPDSGYFFDRPIRKLVQGTVTISRNGAVIATGFSIDYNTGLITFSSAPAAGQIIKIVSAQFHVPVRFDVDEMSITHDDWEQMSWPSIPLVEVKPR
ncbi:hypothetical protein LAV_00020 [Sphingobium phage Lacusarx]|uniref:DUF2460 domain-containing protein n=1 Tax=Sphingobium phage Lacusarx TaxID=1980139 RepID=A0A1W6DWM9_9CAUD|nr:glycoside hydrolase [Sphingobium phage Lacusarx]ARK07420.1 hypothetical protein LAV_00020 [Sphingobium phage Lacusarx]